MQTNAQNLSAAEDSPSGGEVACLRKQCAAAYSARFGMTLGVIVVMTSLGFATFSYFNALRPYLLPAAIGMGILSLALYCFRSKRSGSDLAEEEILKFWHNPGYWSFVIIVSTLLTYVLCSSLFARREQAQPVVGHTKPIEPPKPQEPVVFPPLQVMGLVFNGTNSSAVINRHTVQLGDTFNGVEIVEILPEGVVVELAQQRKTLLLGAVPETSPGNTKVNKHGARGFEEK